MTLEISKILCLSTGHITAEDAELLDKGTITVYPKTDHNHREEYGWFIHVDPDRESKQLYKDFSDAFKALITLAIDNECRWIDMDRDGPLEPDLPSFEW